MEEARNFISQQGRRQGPAQTKIIIANSARRPAKLFGEVASNARETGSDGRWLGNPLSRIREKKKGNRTV
jgi:hypothetical protein